MASNTRGKIKEHLEGIHRNFDWIIYHCGKILVLIADKNPKLKMGIEALAKGVNTLDEICQSLYGKI